MFTGSLMQAFSRNGFGNPVFRGNTSITSAVPNDVEAIDLFVDLAAALKRCSLLQTREATRAAEKMR